MAAGVSAALRWMGLPIKWLAWWGRWLSETVAVHYADAPDDFVVTSEAVLPWPSDDPTGEFVWRAVSLRDVFPREVLELCAPDADDPPNGEMMEMGRRGVGVDRAQGSPRVLPLRGLLGGRTGLAHETRGPLRPLRLLRGAQVTGAGRGEMGGEEVIDVDADPPPASAAGSSIRRLRIAARKTGEVASVLGKRKAAGPARIVGAAARTVISRHVGATSVGAGAPSDR